MTQSIYKRHDVEGDCPYIRARGSFVKCMITPGMDIRSCDLDYDS